MGLDGGGNLTAASLACNIISGASVLFFEASLPAVKGKGTPGSGERFRQTIRGYLPWEHMGAEPPEEVVRLVYKFRRNPLAHSLGVGKSGHVFGFKKKHVLMAKAGVGLSRTQVVELMRGEPAPPAGYAPVVLQGPRDYTVDVAGFAWAVCRMIRNLFADRDQMQKSMALAEDLAHGVHDPHAELEDDGDVNVGLAGHASDYGVASSVLPPPRENE